MYKALKKISLNAILLSPDNFAEQEKQNCWIGREPSSDEAIAKAEQRLGVSLPNDVKEFYKVSNGTAEILSHTFSGFDAIEKIDWLKNAIPDIITNYAEMGETYAADLTNSIIIAGVNHVHNILIIQPHGVHKNWRYWEFTTYTPGENEFAGVEKYLDRLDDFLSEQIKNKNETLGQ